MKLSDFEFALYTLRELGYSEEEIKKMTFVNDLQTLKDYSDVK